MSAPGARATCPSPLGPLTLDGGPGGLRALRFDVGGAAAGPEGGSGPLADAAAQLAEYFAGERRRFELPLDLMGTPWQRRVWELLLAIPYGATTSYGALARAAGRPGAVRAVAAAVARTPVPIVVPCHRVLSAGGALTGYVGGLERKAALLRLEGAARRPGA